jgi:WD40 repeat protein
MYVRLLAGDNKGTVAASMSEGRILLAGYDERRALGSVTLPENCYKAFSFSADLRFMATGYWYTKGVDVWDVQTGQRVVRFGPSQTSRVLLDPAGECIIVWSDRGKFARNWRTGRELRIRYLEDLYGAAVGRAGEFALLPLGLKRRVLRLDFRRLEPSRQELPINDVVWTMRWSPRFDRFIVLSQDRRLSCFADWNGPLLWARDFAEGQFTSNGSFTADGRYLLLNCIEAMCVLALDAASGETVRRIEAREDPAYPLEGPTAMTSTGKIIDAETGRVYDGVSKPAWWRAAGF